MGRTLVVERHAWETSGSGHQLQFPRAAFREFFDGAGYYRFRVFDPPHETQPTRITTAQVSQYGRSATYRLNRILEIGTMGPGFVLIEEIDTPKGLSYDIWWLTGSDAAKIARKKWQWRQARGSQYGPGRHWTILRQPGPRTL